MISVLVLKQVNKTDKSIYIVFWVTTGANQSLDVSAVIMLRKTSADLAGTITMSREDKKNMQFVQF